MIDEVLIKPIRFEATLFNSLDAILLETMVASDNDAISQECSCYYETIGRVLMNLR